MYTLKQNLSCRVEKIELTELGSLLGVNFFFFFARENLKIFGSRFYRDGIIKRFTLEFETKDILSKCLGGRGGGKKKKRNFKIDSRELHMYSFSFLLFSFDYYFIIVIEMNFVAF